MLSNDDVNAMQVDYSGFAMIDQDRAGEASGGRQARRRDMNWEQHEARLKTMYLVNNRKLEDIMEIMRNEHGFVASYAVAIVTDYLNRLLILAEPSSTKNVSSCGAGRRICLTKKHFG